MAKLQLYAALNALQEIVFVLDKRRYVLFANQLAEHEFGVGHVDRDFVQVLRQPDCINMIDQVIQGQSSMGKTVSIEYPIKSTFDILVSRLEGEEDHVLVSMRDVSDLKEAEQMRSDFVANVSHELRSPLTSLSGFIETLQGPAKKDPAAQDKFLGLMEKEASRMARLVSDLLSLSKVEANLRVRPIDRVDVEAIIRSVKANLSGQAKKEDVSIEIDFDDYNTEIVGNEDELTQVFQNLIENAIKYGAKSSTVKIIANIKEGVAGIPNQALCVKIIDRGEGIGKHHLARLTERFYRVDTDRSRDKGGTGLGLAIVKHIINRHRGRMQIESEEGVGSTFSVYLPLTH